MTIFEKVKSIVTPKDLALKVLGTPVKRSGNTLFYYSPLRLKEKTPSFAVNDKKGFTDFGVGKNYDIFSFIAELYNCNIKKSCILIANMYGIDIDTKISDKNLKLLKRQMEEKNIIQNTINTWHNDMYDVFTSIYKQYRDIRISLPSNSTLLPFIYKKEQYFEALVDLFYDNNPKSKLILYKNKERFKDYEIKRKRGVL